MATDNPKHANGEVSETVLTAQRARNYLGWVSVSHIQSLHTHVNFHASPPASPTSPASDTTAFSLLSDVTDTTVVDRDFASAWEKANFYKGVSEDPPHLFQRSDIRTRPFTLPPAEDQHTAIPEKTARGVCHAVLTADLWRETVGPAIVDLLEGKKDFDITVTMMLPVQFSFFRREIRPRRYHQVLLPQRRQSYHLQLPA
ncbi:hypothetical protein HGRIS_013862 [Hohenbuehelia grisea]|uniref:Uncharacterized protein n=1 Tax=Hohenbuehelia grisea TaxID=104357 RepID=A0ABR3IX14_9AGAR